MKDTITEQILYSLSAVVANREDKILYIVGICQTQPGSKIRGLVA